jgi:hypothetical protein
MIELHRISIAALSLGVAQPLVGLSTLALVQSIQHFSAPSAAARERPPDERGAAYLQQQQSISARALGTVLFRRPPPELHLGITVLHSLGILQMKAPASRSAANDTRNAPPIRSTRCRG